MKNEIFMSILSNLLDNECDLYGVRSTIAKLLDMDCTKEDLLVLNFDEEDIDAVINYESLPDTEKEPAEDFYNL